MTRGIELTKRDYHKNALLVYGAPLVPVVTTVLFSIVFFALFVLNIGTFAAAAYFFFGIIAAVAGLIFGLILMFALFWYRAAWLKKLRENLAVDGIKTSEVEWFKNELTSGERQSLRQLKRLNPMLADAYRETLASRLTASRILQTSKNELLLVERRQNKLKYLKNADAAALAAELKDDRERLKAVKNEAETLLAESKARLESIEAAARRGTSVASSEQAVKILSERTAQLPLALESARLEDEIRRQLERETSK
jgi:hypothetical protein